MNKTFLIILSVLLSSKLIESRPRNITLLKDKLPPYLLYWLQESHYNYHPRSEQNNEQTDVYGYRFWSKFVKSSEESSEDDSFETCVNCSQTNIGNGHMNRNIIHYDYRPRSEQNNEQTDVYQEIEEQSENESQLVTYRPTLKQGYNSFGNELPEGDENYNNQRPFRPNPKPIHENRRPYNDYNQKRTSEIGDFGNGHHNTNTFNIHKKNIYIS